MSHRFLLALIVLATFATACSEDRPVLTGTSDGTNDSVVHLMNPDGTLRAVSADSVQAPMAPATVRLAEAGAAAQQAPVFAGTVALAVKRQGNDATRLTATVTHNGQAVAPRAVPLSTFSDPRFLLAMVGSRGDTLTGADLYGYAPLADGWELMVLGLKGSFFAGAQASVVLAGLPIQRATGATRPPLFLGYSYQQVAADMHTVTWLAQLKPGGAYELVLANKTLIERERGVSEEARHLAFEWQDGQFIPLANPTAAQLKTQYPM